MNPSAFVPSQIRNVAIVGHGHSGKTSLAEAILYDEGATTRLGSVEGHTSYLDTEPEEVHRGGSIFSHFGWVEHKGKKINFIDTPGDQNFFLDGLTSLMGADGIIAVISAVSGVGIQAKKAWAAAKERHLSRSIFINKMDRASADWRDLVRMCATSFSIEPLAVQIPLGRGTEFRGVVDLFTGQALLWNPDGSGKMTRENPPESMREEIEKVRTEMKEQILTTNDELLASYLDGKSISSEELYACFQTGVRKRKLFPVYFGSALLNAGIQPIVDCVADAFPSPLDRGPLACFDMGGNPAECFHDSEHPFVAQVIHTSLDENSGALSMIRVFSGEIPRDGIVFNSSTGETVRLGTPFVVRGREKTKIDRVVCGDLVSASKLKNTHTGNTLCTERQVVKLPMISYPQPMISYVLIPEGRGDDEKLKVALDRLREEDPSLSYSIDEVTHRMTLHGMGHGHLESAVERLRRRFDLHVKTMLPPIAYRETIARAVRMAEGKQKKQTGGAGQYGVCWIDVEPLPRGGGYEFVDEIKGGSIPRPFIPSVEKGVQERAKRGLLGGYPVVDFRVRLKDGKHHPVDSKDVAFQVAGYKAFHSALEEAGSLLLEPVYKMEIVAPSEYAGSLTGDISSRRGQIHGIDVTDHTSVISASCPLAEVQTYLPDLRALTGGKGSFVMEFDHYQVVPAHLTDKIRRESPFLENSKEQEINEEEK